MKLRKIAFSIILLTHNIDGFVNLSLRAIETAPFSAVSTALTAIGGKPPSPDELRARAAAIREELKDLEASAAESRRTNTDLVEKQTVRESSRLGTLPRD